MFFDRRLLPRFSYCHPEAIAQLRWLPRQHHWPQMHTQSMIALAGQSTHLDNCPDQVSLLATQHLAGRVLVAGHRQTDAKRAIALVTPERPAPIRAFGSPPRYVLAVAIFISAENCHVAPPVRTRTNYYDLFYVSSATLSSTLCGMSIATPFLSSVNIASPN